MCLNEIIQKSTNDMFPLKTSDKCLNEYYNSYTILDSLLTLITPTDKEI